VCMLYYGVRGSIQRTGSLNKGSKKLSSACSLAGHGGSIECVKRLAVCLRQQIWIFSQNNDRATLPCNGEWVYHFLVSCQSLGII
jgi:hypothetical protein